MNIGDINFGVDASTEGLQKAVAQLRRFSREVDRVASSQVKGASNVANAMGRQESAIKKAYQQTLNLRRAQQQVGAPAHELAATTKAFQRLTREMSSGRLSVTEYQRSIDAFNAKLNRLSRSMKDLKAEQAREKLGRFNEIMRDLQSASVLALGPLSGLGARIMAIGGIFGRSALAIAAFITGVVAVTGAFTILTAAAGRTALVIENIEARFKAATGSAAGAALEFRYVSELSNRLAIQLQATAAGYSRLTAASRGTNLEGKATRKIFEGVAVASAALRMDALSTEGALRAVEQIMSKGYVQAEELRGQLGERLPGAFTIAAAAMDATTQELNAMLKAGEVTAEEFLPRFAQALKEFFGKDAANNVNSLQGALNLLSNAVLAFNMEFNETLGIGEKWAAIIRTATDVTHFFTQNLRTVLSVLGAVAGAAAGALAAIYGPAALSGFVALVGLIRKAAIAMAAFNVAVLANPIGRLASWIVKIIGALAGAVAGFFLMNRALGKNAELMDDTALKVEAFIVAAKRSGSALKSERDDLLAATRARVAYLKATQASLQAQLEFVRSDSSLMGFMAELFGSEQSLSSLQDALALTNAELDKFKKFIATLAGLDAAGIEMDHLNKETRKVADNIDELYHKVQTLRRAISKDSKMEILDVQALGKAQEMLKGLSADELAALQAEMRKYGFAGVEVERAIANLLLVEGKLDEVLKKRLEHMDRLPTVTAEYNRELQKVSMTIKALKAGPIAAEALERQLEYNDKLLEMEKNLRSAGIEGDELATKMEAYRKLLDELAIAQDRFSMAGKQMADAITNGLADIILQADSAKDVLHGLLQEILRIILQRYVLQQFNAWLTSAFGNLGSMGSGTPTPTPMTLPGNIPTTGPIGAVSMGPGRAHGGPVRKGMAYPVNEQLPGQSEWFTPSVNGTIVPANKVGGQGGGDTIITTVHVDARGNDVAGFVAAGNILRKQINADQAKRRRRRGR